MKKVLLTAVFMACESIGAVRADAEDEMSKATEKANEAVRAQVSREMAEMDENKDGLVSEAEFLAYRVKLYEAGQKKIFAEIDTDGDKFFSAVDLENSYNRQLRVIADSFKGLVEKIKEE